MAYKFSDYLTVVSHKDECLLAQGITGKALVIKQRLFDEVAKNLNKKVPSKIKKIKERLKKIFMIVSKKFNEQEFAKAMFEVASEDDKKECALTFVLTWRCNFACPYCYENENKNDMKKDIIDQALRTLFRKARKVKPKIIKIGFYGGEPLLNFNMLEYAVRKTRKFCQKHNIRAGFDIVSNGSIWTQEIVDLFYLDNDLDTIQVTLDGPRNIHNKRRYFKNGKGSYAVIMKNLTLMAKTATVIIIRINVDEDNKNSIPKLIQELRKTKIKNLMIFPGAVYGSYKGEKYCGELLDVHEYDKLENSYYEKAKELGVGISSKKQNLLNYNPVFCAASRATPHWIDPDGEMYPCGMALSNKSLSVGNIFKGYDKKKAKRWLRYNVINNKRCIKCRHIFFCGGPDLYQAMKGEDHAPLCGNGFKNLLLENFNQIKKTLPYIK